jgi:hypothetical protein
MSVEVHIQTYLDSKVPLFRIVDEALGDWSGEGCLQFPVLMGIVNTKMGWEDEEGKKTSRANEPIVRDYVRNHPDWYVTRGAHGGIMRRADKLKKEEALAAKAKAKAELAAAIEAEVARKKALAQQTASVSIATDNTNTDSE